VGDGPVQCSSSTELSVWPSIIHDVNGYYRELGVTPWATRRELREAYQAKGGPDDVRLTYIFGQLLNKEVRRAYDSMGFGEVFMDQYVRDEIKRFMLARKSERMQDLHDLGVNLDDVDEGSLERDIYSQMGIDTEPDGVPKESRDTPLETVDEKQIEAQDVSRPATQFPYAYYLYKVSLPGREVVSRLQDWQRFLIAALAREGIRTQFAVGLHGEPHRWMYAQVGYRKVFFLADHQMPTEELATMAAQQVRQDLDPAA
jgi:hypothetical protein